MKVELREDILRHARPAILPGIPLATYRLQFNQRFTFRDAAAIVPYLRALGVTHCYASPYLKSRSGSGHGYDIVDHSSLNPEIGTREEFEHFVSVLKEQGMSQILDIVPNHMGVGGNDNAWWLDVLENGQSSPYAGFFDIDWRPLKEELRGKVLLPVLGDHYGKILETGQLKLLFDAETGQFSVSYFEHRFPIDPGTYPVLLEHRLDQLRERLPRDDPQLMEYESLIAAFAHLPRKRETAPEKREERRRDKDILMRRLARSAATSNIVSAHIGTVVADYNGSAGDDASFESLHKLLDQQAYRLAYWRVASDEVNYRRFFDINSLAGLRTERPDVFRATHSLIIELVEQGKLQGLRIDHPDGLYDPAQYYHRLQSGVARNPDGGPGLYVVAEKILASHEHLREDWPVHGTTGYEFANLVNGVFVDPNAERALTRLYERFTGRSANFDELLYERKKLIMKVNLAGELAVLANLANQISEADWHTRDFTTNGLREAIMEVVACFPVYRTYVTPERVTTEDRRFADWAVAQAKKRSFAGDISIFDFLQRLLLLDGIEHQNLATRQMAVDFALKFQQYTAPVMAKGLEDTAFYIYNRLISLNEVGGDPRRFGISVSAFHHANQERLRRWAHSLLSTSTHDSKRSEDVRARIDVLTELPREWSIHLRRWGRINRIKKRRIESALAPDRNDEYLLYQTLIGAWPAGAIDQEELSAFEERVQSYMLKAVREAKMQSSWLNPNAEYEQAVREFVKTLFARPHQNRFLADFLPFQARISRAGALNSLSQTLLKLTAPGVPDIYQGTELFDFSLVDPDNRRRVDYSRRAELLRALGDETGINRAAARAFVDRIDEGLAKLHVIRQTLALRRKHPDLFQSGSYQPLGADGPRAEHLCGFARANGPRTAVIVAARWFMRLMTPGDAMPPAEIWMKTTIDAPAPGLYRNLLTGEPVHSQLRESAPSLPVDALLASFPVALLVHEQP